MDLIRPNDDLRVGGDVESQCTKCRRPTTHTIVTMDGEKPKRVQCQSCKSEHNFRPPALASESAKAKDMKPTTKKKTTAPAKVEAPKGEDFEDLGLAADLMSIEEDDGVPPFSVEGFDLDSGASKEKSKAKGKAAKGEAKKEPRATTTKAAKPKTESKAKPKTETKSKAETKPVKEAKPKTETKPKAEAKPKAEPKPKAEAKPKTESKAKPKAEAKPKPLKEPTGTKATATKPRGSRSTSKGELKGLQDIDALKEWEEKNSSLDKAKVQPYDINQSYFKGQAINHATFGVGFVSEVVYPNKIQVKFQHFSKRLIMNVPQPNSKA